MLKRKRLRSLLLSVCCVGIVYVSYQIILALKLTLYLKESILNLESDSPSDTALRRGPYHVDFSYHDAVPAITEKGSVFTCDAVVQLIPSQINDDYCDCLDGTDETETSACPHSTFSCKSDKRVIPSSRVNDGICDCCDGSDEWMNITSILHISRRDQILSGVFLSPCMEKIC